MFADLGFTDPAERQARLRLAYVVNQVLEARKLTGADAAKVLGIKEPKVGELEGALQHCASRQDSHETNLHGAVGVWEHGGESGEYRYLRVETLDGMAV